MRVENILICELKIIINRIKKSRDINTLKESEKSNIAVLAQNNSSIFQTTISSFRIIFHLTVTYFQVSVVHSIIEFSIFHPTRLIFNYFDIQWQTNKTFMSFWINNSLLYIIKRPRILIHCKFQYPWMLFYYISSILYLKHSADVVLLLLYFNIFFHILQSNN